MVTLILAFIFLTPRAWFRDQPRANSVVLMPGGNFLIEPDLLSGVAGQRRIDRANEILRNKYGKPHKVVRVEAMVDDSEEEVKGYIAYVTE